MNRRLLSLIRKEFNQIRRDRRLALSLIVPPTLQLLLFGFALNATVDNLRMGVVDLSQTPQSRDLIAAMTQSGAFRLGGRYSSAQEEGNAIARGDLDAGIVIPNRFGITMPASRSPRAIALPSSCADEYRPPRRNAPLCVMAAIRSRLCGVWLRSTTPMRRLSTVAFRAKPNSSNCRVGGTMSESARRRSRRI